MPEIDKRSPQPPTRRPRELARPPKPDGSALAQLLDEWMQGDGKEQRDTFEALRRSLDEDRPDGYKLFS
jgi:hypothetical protein